MANKVIGDYTSAVTIDGATHFMLIQPGNAGTAYKKISRNVLLGVTGQPMDISSSQNVTNKTLDNTNTITLKDTLFTLQDDGDTTKQARFQLSGITTATTRTYTLPNASSTLMDISTTQTATNKTLTSPVITGGSIDNTTVTVDSIAGHTASTTGTIYGITITSGIITSSNSVNPAALVTGIQTSKFSNPYKFNVYRNAAANTGNAAFALVTFDTKTFDTGTNYNTSTGVFTAPIAGFYYFCWQIGTTGAGTRLISALAYNSTTVEYKRGTDVTVGSSVESSVGGALIQMSANDTASVLAFGNAANALAVGTGIQTYFMGYLVSAT